VGGKGGGKGGGLGGGGRWGGRGGGGGWGGRGGGGGGAGGGGGTQWGERAKCLITRSRWEKKKKKVLDINGPSERRRKCLLDSPRQQKSAHPTEPKILARIRNKERVCGTMRHLCLIRTSLGEHSERPLTERTGHENQKRGTWSVKHEPNLYIVQ